MILAVAVVVSDLNMISAGQINPGERPVIHDKNKEQGSLKIRDIKQNKELKELSSKHEKIVEEATSVSKTNGKKAGKVLNKLNKKSDAFEVGVKEVLDEYFSADEVNHEQVEKFSESLQVDIEEKVKDYAEARKERENDKNLNYASGEEILFFDKDTSLKDIDKLVNHISDSYEIVWDNSYKVDPTLSEDDQKRLKALEKYEGDIIVKVNLDLDQTVNSAAEEFEKYECVSQAVPNGRIETNGLISQLNDNYAYQAWYLDRCGFQEAWDTQDTAGAYGIKVAVVDSGCRITHCDLAGRIDLARAVDVTQRDANGNYKKLGSITKLMGFWIPHIINPAHINEF